MQRSRVCDPWRVSSRVATGLLALLGLALGPSRAAENDPAGTRPLEEWKALTASRLEAIRAEESRNGPHSAALVDELAALGLLYEEDGRHELAVETLERGLQVLRANLGLYSLEQFPLLRFMAASARAHGDPGAAAELERRMLRLAWTSPDDPRSIAIFREAAERQIASYERYLAGDIEPTLNVNVSMAPGPPMRRTFAPEQVALWQARRNYEAAIRGVLNLAGNPTAEAVELERALIRTYYLEATAERTPPDRREMLYRLGRESYRRLVVYRTTLGRSVSEYAGALVELADWDLIFSRNGIARDGYAEAFAVLRESGAPAAEIDALFPPTTPVLLPTFVSNPLAAEPAPPRNAPPYIELSFELGRYGTSRNVEILDASAKGTDDAARAAARVIATHRFRPQPTLEAVHEAAPYRVRYYSTP